MLQKILNIFKSDFIKKFSIYGFGQFVNLVTPLLIIPNIIKVCGVENFGKISVALAISFFLIVFIDYGSELVGVRDIASNRKDLRKREQIFLTNFISRFFVLILTLILALVVVFSISLFNEEATLYIFSLLILLGQYLNQSWFLQAVDNMNWISYANILSKLIYVGGVLILVNTPDDYIYVNLCFAFGNILANSLFTILIFKKYFIKFRMVPVRNITEFLQKDFKIFSSQIFVGIQNYAPVFLVSILGNNILAGQYRIVEQIIITFKTFIFLFFNFTYPRVCNNLAEMKTNLAIRNWGIINIVHICFISFSMFILYINAETVIIYFNTVNIPELSQLLKIAVFFPVVLAISIAGKQLVLGFNFLKQYVFITMLSVLLSLLAIIITFESFKLNAVFYSLIITELIVIIFYVFCIIKNRIVS